MTNVVVGLFTNNVQAGAVIRALKSADFSEESLGMVTQDIASTTNASPAIPAIADSFTAVDQTLSHDGAVAGSILGGTLGVLLATTGVLVIPGVGPLIVAGILLTAITGGALGAIAGALVGLGVPNAEAKYYEDQVRAGRTLVTVLPNGRDASAIAILAEYGAELTQDAQLLDAAAVS